MNDAKYLADLTKNLKLSANGEWWHDNRPFENRKLIDLFNRSIVWDETNNRYLLQIGGNQAKFEYEDTVYFVVSLNDHALPWKVLISDQSEEVLNVGSLELGDKDQIDRAVKDSHRARFARGAHQQLLEHATDDHSILIGSTQVTLVKRRLS